MTLLVTDAVVLQAFEYLETSRILRLATREVGVVSVLARGARRPRSKFGSALDLFSQGVAELHTKQGRELHTLSAFEVTRARPGLALDLGRFTAAAALAELALGFVHDDPHPALYELLVLAFDEISAGEPAAARSLALAGAWRLVAELGFTPSIDACGECHTTVSHDDSALFSHPAGGVLCPRCSRLVAGSRTLPASARVALRRWLAGETLLLQDDAEIRAHQRLLREFLGEHLADGRAMRAFDIWEHGRWSGG